MSTLDLDLAIAQARSVLARATSGHATWLDPEYAERHDSLVTAIYLDHPEQPASGHRSPVMLEIADPAPVPVRDRVRATVRVYGDAARSGEDAHGLRIQPGSVHLETGGRTLTLNPVDLWLAEPDPLALCEAELLGHLDSCHPETVDMLAALIPDEFRAHARRIAPIALDRSGIVLRVEHAAGHLDVRLAFPVEATDPDQAAQALAALLGAAEPSGPTDGKGARRRGLLAAVLGAGPAAARICTPRSTSTPSTHGFRR